MSNSKQSFPIFHCKKSKSDKPSQYFYWPKKDHALQTQISERAKESRAYFLQLQEANDNVRRVSFHDQQPRPETPEARVEVDEALEHELYPVQTRPGRTGREGGRIRFEITRVEDENGVEMGGAALAGVVQRRVVVDPKPLAEPHESVGFRIRSHGTERICRDEATRGGGGDARARVLVLEEAEGSLHANLLTCARSLVAFVSLLFFQKAGKWSGLWRIHVAGDFPP